MKTLAGRPDGASRRSFPRAATRATPTRSPEIWTNMDDFKAHAAQLVSRRQGRRGSGAARARGLQGRVRCRRRRLRRLPREYRHEALVVAGKMRISAAAPSMARPFFIRRAPRECAPTSGCRRRKLETSYFSFGEWMRSSSRPKPIISESMPRIRLKSPTTGIDPPAPISAGLAPHSSASARSALAAAMRPSIGRRMRGARRHGR